MSTHKQSILQQLAPQTLVSRLLSGFPAEDETTVEAYPGEWNPIIQAVRSADRDQRLHAFNQALENRVDADLIRAAVFAVSPTGKSEAAGTDAESEEFHWLPQVEIPELPHLARLPSSLEQEAAHTGKWLNSYVEFASQASPMTPRAFHEIFGLIAIATAIARRVCVQVACTRIYPNLFALIVAHSTLYRKTTGAKILENIIKAAGLQAFLLPNRLTPESFLRLLSGQKPSDYEHWGETDRQDWEKERLYTSQRCWLIEEASSLFESFDVKYSAGLLPLVLDLWDCPEIKTVDTIGRGRTTIRNAYLSICGITTPAALQHHLKRAAHWGNGLWARFAFVTPTSKPIWNFWPQSIEMPSALPAALRILSEERLPQPKLQPSGEIIPASTNFAVLGPQVWEQWEAYGRALEYELLLKGGISPNLHSTYGRLATLAVKVATLLATIDWAEQTKSASPIVTLPHWARAQMIVEGWRASAHRLITAPIAESAEESLEFKVRRLLKRHPPGLSSRELAIKLSMTKSLERREVDSTLTAMLQDGLVKRASRHGKRGPSTEVWIAELNS